MAAMISRRTWMLVILGIALIAAIASGIALNVGGESGVTAISDIGEFIVVALSAAVILAVALSFAPGEPVRLQWLAIGLGVLMFAIGDGVWTFIEVFQGLEPPYPGAPDAFYLLEYPLLAIGLTRAALAYRGLVDLRRPALISGAIVIVTTSILWFTLLQPHVLLAELPLAETVVSLLYPMADVILGLGPALLIALVVRQLGRGLLGWPWWAVVAGVSVLALSDTGFSLLQAYDKYEAGAIVDYGWAAAHLLIAVGASVVYDLAHPAAARVLITEPAGSGG